MKTKITIILLFFTFNIICVKAQIKQVKTTLPVYKTNKTYAKSSSKKPQKVKGTLVAPNGKHYFFTDKRYFRYSKVEGVEKIANTKPNWAGIPDNIDGVFVNKKNKKAYFFKGSKYNRWDFKNGNDNPEFAISKFWKGVPNNIDAVTNHTNGKIYFFKGNTYYRYDPKLKKVDKSALISKNWKGVPNDVAAALLHANGKIYFIKDNKYYRYNITSKKVEWDGIIGKDGWKGLDFNKKIFTKKIVKAPVVSTKDNIRLKVTLTRIKSIQARDSDNIADFIVGQKAYYTTNGIQKLAIQKKIRVGKNMINTDDVSSSIINVFQTHVREGDEKHFINNSLVYEITPQEIKDKRAEFNFYTNLGENDGKKSNWFTENIFKLFKEHGLKIKKIASNHQTEVSIHEVLAYLQNPTSSKYGGSYFKGGRNGKMHEYGAFGDVMWMQKGTNNSLIGHLEFGDNNKETYMRLYYRFELVD